MIRQSIEEKRFRAVGFGFNNYTRKVKITVIPGKIKFDVISPWSMVHGACSE